MLYVKQSQRSGRPMSQTILLAILFLLLCFTLSSLSLAAAGAGAVEGPKIANHPLITPYPGSKAISGNLNNFEEFNLPVGRFDASKTFTKTEHLEGKITSISYSNPPGRSALEIFRNYQSALTQKGFQVLFSCSGSQCITPGWNYGVPDPLLQWCDTSDCGQPMRYLAAKLPRPEGAVWVGLLVFPGGPARCACTHMKIIELKPMEGGLVTVNAETLAQDIAHMGHASIYGIYFDSGKADIKPESEPVLKEIVALLKKNNSLKLNIVGHTDNVGTKSANLELSKRRAQAVVNALTTKYQIAPARLTADGVGQLAPVSTNRTEEGRAKNRRVELVEQ